MVTVTTNTSLGVDSPQGRKIFIFDRVFGEDVNQRGVWDYLQDSVDSFLQGYNVSILAYGQSGAGKSYTMGTSGPTEQNDPSKKGTSSTVEDNVQGLTTCRRDSSGRRPSVRIPSAFRGVSFEADIRLEDSKSVLGRQHGHCLAAKHPWDVQIWHRSQMGIIGHICRGKQLHSMIVFRINISQIYNEQPRDLLLPESVSQAERPAVLIREDAKGRIYLEGLKSVPINTIDEMLAVLNHGSTIRQTDATSINARSSRSHAVFTVNLKQTKPQNTGSTTRDKRSSVPIETMSGSESTITVESKLHFVDLAGSERLKNTGATGDRAKEGISINAGLASLGKVISQLSSRSHGTHVSYRDSKLTRMLQDSLGGNAITYMIACVTPAEFHQSETLNTVQYAQRARNIQSKPKIQQISDDADKQALIDRLRSEVAFLRQQIRSAETGDRRTGAFMDRVDRPNEREMELQTQLLDVQESYGALSQRHAKLISELTQSSETQGDLSAGHIAGESAVDRLKRSQANQAQIEQVVLEYEKTIQSLEANLSTTRASLANTESNLLERETKCAYVETMNQQLHARVQKLMDREANTETYLRDLEMKLEGQTSGEERSDAVIADLRKEIARIRESETNAEDYITTLEERLAEADQDMELMQRELERLDHLVERQRSLGKLDNLLYELDHIQKDTESTQKVPDVEPAVKFSVSEQERALETLKEAEETELPAEVDGELERTSADVEKEIPVQESNDDLKALEKATTTTNGDTPELAVPHESPQPSPAQTKFVTEKFETVSQELFDLRLEHEATINEYDLLSAKYQEALRTLAEMQDAIDEARHGTPEKTQSSDGHSRPASFLEDATIHDLRNEGHLPSSRSLSSELSSAGESHTSIEPSENGTVSKNEVSAELASPEVERLQLLLSEHERGMNLISQQYAELQAEHKDALKTMEGLKVEVQKSRFREQPASPTVAAPGMLRRMSSQITGVDRAQRSITSLRTLISEEFEDRPDRLEGFEVHLSAANHELQSRMERIQSLEAENKNVKKEMELKQTIISGLTRERERSSLKGASPVDLSMISQMRDQLIQKETQLKALHEAYANREHELQTEIEKLTAEKTRSEALVGADREMVGEADTKFKELLQRFDELSAEHAKVRDAAESSQQQANTTVAELAAALATIETLKSQQPTGSDDSQFEKAATANAMQAERDQYRDLVDGLKRTIEEHRSSNAAQSESISKLEQTRVSLQTQLDEQSRTIEQQRFQIENNLQRIAQLEKEILEAQSAVEFHKHGLKSLHETHRSAIEELKLSHAGAMAEIDEQITHHLKTQENLKAEMAKEKNRTKELVADAQKALGHATSPEMLANHIQDLFEEKRHISEANERLTRTNAELERQLTGRQSLEELEEGLQKANEQISNYKDTIRNLANEVGNNEDLLRQRDIDISKLKAAVDSVNAEKQKKIDLIEELEQQLQNSFDQHNKRVSSLQAQGNQALAEAQQRIAALEKEVDVRKSLVESETIASRSNTMKSQNRPHSPATDTQQRSNSLTSNLRKSASLASLPSPPPAIPLPPLPSLPSGVVAPSNPSPPSSRHTSREITPSLQHLSVNGTVSPTGFPQPPTSTSRDSKDTAGSGTLVTVHSARQSSLIEEQETKLRVLEKHLQAEKQLTVTLEEALVDLETQSNKLRADAEAWKKKAWAAEEELNGLRKDRKSDQRLSVQQVEEERIKRVEAERAREVLEERMRALAGGNLANGGGGGGPVDPRDVALMKKKKRKGGGLNCF